MKDMVRPDKGEKQPKQAGFGAPNGALDWV